MNQTSERFAWLDALRGIAALLVLASHFAMAISPTLNYAIREQFNSGNLGVIVFLLVSGYIIPRSLEAQGSLGIFWVRRFFRLWPLYLVSLVAALLIRPQPWTTGIVNATMLQGFVGVPDVLAVYWTLTLELAFYIAVSLLFAAGVRDRPVAVALGFVLLAFPGELILVITTGLHLPSSVASGLAIMGLGTVLAGVVEGRVSVRRAALVAVAVMLAVTILRGVPFAYSAPRLLGLVIFIAALALRHRSAPAWLLWCGRVSYSIYLVHAIVLQTLPRLANPVLMVAAWTGVTLLLAALSYRWIEQPGIALGRRLTRGRQSAQRLPLPAASL